MKYYAGIGPRATPKHVQDIMTDIARQLVPTGWCLRSGHAEGADQAFERGAANKQIFIPWERFNGARSNGKDTAVVPYSERCEQIAADHHPNWEFLSQGAQKLMMRNVHIILGERLDDPVECVIYWTPEPNYRGGTTHALKIASTYGVPTFNLAYRDDQIAMCRFIMNVENRSSMRKDAA